MTIYRNNAILKCLFLTFLLPVATQAQLRNPTNIPLQFYGKIVDQDNKPLVGVGVKLEVRSDYFEENRSEGKSYSLETDKNGNFTLTGAVGSTINILSITNEGYELSPKIKRGYVYTWGGEIFHPDSANPVVFKMWKKGLKESLIVGSKFYGIVPDGRAYTIDFVQQKKTEEISSTGDVIVRIHRPTTIPLHTKFDWSYSIEAINGGIIHTNDEFMYRAPEDGYQSKYELTMSATNVHWQAGVRGEQFYIKSRNGKVYGGIVVEVIPDYKDKSIFNVQYSINPSSSRNLER